MTTTVVKTIGTGGDYTTIAAWEADTPVGGLVAADQIWQGQVKNQSFSETVTIAGTTVDSTRYVELTTQAGASFRDNANVQTNALKFNSSNGAALSSSTAYGQVLSINQDFCRISNLQIAGLSGTTNTLTMAGSFTCTIDNVLAEGQRGVPVVSLSGANALIRNSQITQRGSGASSILKLASGAQSIGNTLTVPTDITHPTNIIEGSYGTPVVKNTAMFGNGAALKTGGNTPTYTTCKSDAASLPSGVTSATYNTSTYQNLTDSTRDFREVSASPLRGAGTQDLTNSTTDIAGTTRNNPPDVGAWEFVAAGGSPTLTGQVATTARGTITPAIDVVVTGRAATTTQGALTPAIAVALTGLRATTAQGTLAASAANSVALTGLAATTAQGAFVPAIDVPLTGLRATTAQGTFAFGGNVSVALTGMAITTAQGALVPSTAVTAALLGISLTAAQGVVKALLDVLLSGQRVTLRQGVFFTQPAAVKNTDLFVRPANPDLVFTDPGVLASFATTKAEELTVVEF
jgi:hypothetical protein